MPRQRADRQRDVARWRDLSVNDVLNITTDAAGLNLNTKTTGIKIFNLRGRLDLERGRRQRQQHHDQRHRQHHIHDGLRWHEAGPYNGGAGFGIDQVTFNVADSQINTAGGSSDIVTGRRRDGGNHRPRRRAPERNDLVLANGDNLSTPGRSSRTSRP